jgi:hypothetical protein
MKRTGNASKIALIVIALALSHPAAAQDTAKSPETKKAKKEERKARAQNLPAVLWRDPGDIPSLDLTYGAGGQEHQPGTQKFKFVEEDLHGTSPKFYVEDDQGVRWLVKLGEEAKPETAATRFVWAMGYFVDEDYYLPALQVEGITNLKRGRSLIGPDGTINGARLKRHAKDDKKVDNWSWFKNPFLGAQQFNGLRVMMALINNWDLTTVNNKMYVKEGTARYVVSDLGASFGKTGGPSSRSKGKLKDYREAKFIDSVKSGYVDFVMATRPLLLTAPVNPANFEKRSHIEDVVKHIPLADVKWIAQRLAQLTPDQIRNAFRAAGFAPDEVEGYADAVQKRIAELNQL